MLPAQTPLILPQNPFFGKLLPIPKLHKTFVAPVHLYDDASSVSSKKKPYICNVKFGDLGV